jgi:Na+-transporting NADH:ubiquinone oxidoreductase subunit NqrB
MDAKLSFIPLFCYSFLWDHIWSHIVNRLFKMALTSLKRHLFPCFVTHNCEALWDHIWCHIVNHSLVLLLIYYTYTTVPVWITVATVMHTGTVSTVHSILRVRYQLFIVYYGYGINSADNWKTIGNHMLPY